MLRLRKETVNEKDEFDISSIMIKQSLNQTTNAYNVVLSVSIRSLVFDKLLMFYRHYFRHLTAE